MQDLLPKTQLSKAFKIASIAHCKQYDKGGKPYILHPIRVMENLKTDDMELQSIAILHDVVEDTDVTFDDLIKEGFSKRVVSALKLLTHKQEDSYEDYIGKICTSLDAIEVKLADITDNSLITRLKGINEKDFKRMQKYMIAYTCLQEAKRKIVTEQFVSRILKDSE